MSDHQDSSDLKGAVTSVLNRLFQSRTKRQEKSFTLSEVACHCHSNDCWIVIRDHVYDITSFLDKHPGGLDVLLENAGRDATVAFFGAGHHPNTIDLIEPFRVGTLAQHERNSHYGGWQSGVALTTGKVKVAD